METTNVILEHLPKVFNRDNDSNNYGFIKSFAYSFDVATSQAQTLSNALFIDTCTGSYLDRKGALYGLSRGSLSDADFRTVIKGHKAGVVGGGINQSIKNSIKGVISCSDSDITITTPSAAIFSINVAVNYTWSPYVLTRAFFDSIKAAGTWVQEITFTSQGGLFLVNVSAVNGTDTIW